MVSDDRGNYVDKILIIMVIIVIMVPVHQGGCKHRCDHSDVEADILHKISIPIFPNHGDTMLIILVVRAPDHQGGCKDRCDLGDGNDVDSETDILHQKYWVPTFHQSRALPKEALHP